MDNPINLSAKQKAAIVDWQSSDVKEICYEGAARSGKTFLIIVAIISRGLSSPGSRHLIARFRFNHMVTTVWKQTLIPLLDQLCKGLYTIDERYTIVTLPGGATIWGAGLDDKERVEKIMGTEFATIFINEATQIGYGTFQKVKTRLSQNAPKLKRKIIVDCNPRNESHWIYKYFIANKDPETNTPLDETRRKQKAHRKFLATENPHLSADYLEILQNLSGTERQRLYEGAWVNNEGLVYPDYQGAIVDPSVIRPDRSWRFAGAVDFGFTNPFCFLWFGYDPANEIWYLFDEYYEREKTVAVHCKELLTRQRCETIVADHDAEDRATMAEHGLYTIAAEKDVTTGIQALNDLLTRKHGVRIRISANCINVLEELSVYSWAQPKEGQNAKEVPVKHFDHAMDAMRYFAKWVLSDSGVSPFGDVGTAW